MAIALCYHSVSKEAKNADSDSLQVQQFKLQLETLKKFLRGISLEELPQSSRTFSVTFDDGYENNLHAAEVLSTLKVPATFFVTVQNLERGEYFYWDLLEFAYKNQIVSVIDLLSQAFDTRNLSLSDATKLVSSLNSETRASLCTQIDGILRLESHAEQTLRERKPLSVTQLQSIASDPLFKIGGHTWTHGSLGAKDGVVDFHQELNSAQFKLKEWLGEFPTEFAYPFGTVEDYTEESVSKIRSAGFKSAWTTRGNWIVRNENVFKMPRLVVGNWPPDQLLKQVFRALARTKVQKYRSQSLEY